MLFLFFADFYDQLFDFADRYREHGIFRLRFLTLTVFCIFTAEEVEKVLRSQAHLTKSKDYDYVQPWLGMGLLTRYQTNILL